MTTFHEVYLFDEGNALCVYSPTLTLSEEERMAYLVFQLFGVN